jgi:undecaprenyl-diphosphatase
VRDFVVRDGVMSLIHVIILAVVQGLAELLPVSSSAHVVVTEKLLGLDPTSPAMTLLLVMLHAGTMLAVILYFWKQWRDAYFASAEKFWRIAVPLVIATALTLIVGGIIIKVIEKTLFKGAPHAEIEDLFGRLDLIAPALLAAGILILVAGLAAKGKSESHDAAEATDINAGQASLIGVVQGLCLPFRGFSRSGATISAGMLAGVPKISAEAFSFALAVILTPLVVGREALRLVHAQHEGGASLSSAVVPSLLGAVFAFLAGLLALKWLSQWLEKGRWYLFGIYCIVAAVAVFALYRAGY